MYATHLVLSRRGLTLSLLSLTLGLSLWATTSKLPALSALDNTHASIATRCRDQSDVTASLDRSRNGISLTCNSETLSRAVAQ